MESSSNLQAANSEALAFNAMIGTWPDLTISVLTLSRLDAKPMKENHRTVKKLQDYIQRLFLRRCEVSLN
jgi:hypothetical protein